MEAGWSQWRECFGTTIGKVFRAVKWIVEWGLKHRDLSGVTKIGVDEIHRGKGHQYMTLVYQLDAENKRLLGVEKHREEKSLERFFDKFDEGTEGDNKRSDAIEFVGNDMWKQYLNVIERRCRNALNILDSVLSETNNTAQYVKSHLTKAVDETRKLDVTKLKSQRREKVLTRSKYIFLKNPENLTEKQAAKLDALLRCNLRVIRAYLMLCFFLK